MSRVRRLALVALEVRTTPSAGLMDTSFGGGDGVVEFGNLPNYYSARALAAAVQPDGKTVLAGTIDSPAGAQALVFRLNVDGSLDTSFSGDGYLTSQFGGNQTHFYGVALQPDGKIVATGSVRIGGSTTVLTARFHADGAPDNSFSGDGYVTTDFSANDEIGFAMALQPDGKVVVVGEAGGFLFLRYTTAGVLDTDFSLDGVYRHQPGGYGAWGRAVAVQADGKIVGAGGGVEVGSPNKAMMLVRLKADGTPDTTFDGDGIVTTLFPGAGETLGEGLTVLPDGRLAAIGVGTVSSMGQLIIARYLPTGTLDTSFDGDGRMLFQFPEVQGGHLTAAAVDRAGRVVAAGYTSFPNDALLMRFDDDGLDPEFGVGNFRPAPGVVYTNVRGDEIHGMAIAPNGRIVTTGRADGYASVLRYTGDQPAVPDEYATDEDTPLEVPAPGVLANDRTTGAAQAAVETGPAHAASFALNADGSFSYTPAPNFFGTDSFTYTLTDDNGTSAPGTVTITVRGLNDPPTAVDDAYPLARIGPRTLSVSAAAGVLANDTDPDGNTLTAVLVEGPARGTLDLKATGSFIYDFPADLSGSITFTYKVNDGTVDGNTATVTLTRPSNQAPAGTADAYEYPYRSPFSVSAALGVLANDTDADGDQRFAELVDPPAAGQVTLRTDGSFDFTYPDGLPGPVTFTYRVTDGRDATGPITVTLTRVPNQPPAGTSDAYPLLVDSPFSVPAAQGVLANDTDPEQSPLTAVIDAAPAVGMLTLNADGSFAYDFPDELVGTVTFTYRPSDGQSAGDPVTVSLTRELLVHVTGGKLTVVGSAGADVVRLRPIGAAIVVEVTSPLGLVRRLMAPAARRFTTVEVYLGAGDDRLDATTLALPVRAVGGAGADYLRTGAGADTLSGDEADGSGFGDDRIEAGNGANVVSGGGGTNSIRTGTGRDVVAAGDGGNVIDTGAGNDSVAVGDGRNTVWTWAGNDVVTAGAGGSWIDAGVGNDVVSVAGGSNWLAGGAGNDVLLGGTGADVIEGQAGNDLVAGGGGADWLDGGVGNDLLFDGQVALVNSTTDSLAAVLARYVPTSRRNLAEITARITVTFDRQSRDFLESGAGRDWFWTDDALDLLDALPSEWRNQVS